MTRITAYLSGVAYRRVLRPLLFTVDPEHIHDIAITAGEQLGAHRVGRALVRYTCSYQHPSLEQKLAGISFKNPVGLAAGFDKDARLTGLVGDIGFGFAEIGSITGKSCQGNERPRLWRLKKSKSLVVNYGLKNPGAAAVSAKLNGRSFAIPIGTSIARTNSPDTVAVEAGIADYTAAHRALHDIGSFTVVNISCPNIFCDYTFADPQKLDALLSSLATVPSKKPMFLKLSPDLDDATTDAIVAVGLKHGIAGFVCTNLTKSHTNGHIKETTLPPTGGMSGKVVEELSNRMIARLYPIVKGKAIIIGCGGVFSAQDAYIKIRLGASLVELVTGMIYEGPQSIGQINRGLVALLRRDGFSSIHDAIGVDAISA